MQGCLIEAHDEHSRSLVGVAQLVILTDSLFEFFEDFSFYGYECFTCMFVCKMCQKRVSDTLEVELCGC